MHPSCGPTHLPGRQQSRQEVVLEAALQLEQFGLLGEGAEESGGWGVGVGGSSRATIQTWSLTGTSGKLRWFFLPTRWPTPTHRPCRGGGGGQMSLAGGQRVGEPTNQESPVGECVSVDCPHCA